MINGFICLGSFACFNELVERGCFQIKTIQNQFFLVTFRSSICNDVNKLGFAELLGCVEVGRHLNASFVQVTDRDGANILPCCNVLRLAHGVPYVPLLF